MKILAIEKEVPGVDWNTVSKELMAEEANHIYKLYLSAQLREHYFNDEKCAVLVLECSSKNDAVEVLNTLPLVKNNLITFDLMELHPYTGYERIINLIPPKFS
jgi:hypothetical protein